MAGGSALVTSFFASLAGSGLPPVPETFSVVPAHQLVPAATLAQIARFIAVFNRVTTGDRWREAVRRNAPPIAQLLRPETCFFSAWDFHLPPDGDCQLIEFNDNGSGFLFAAIINAAYYNVAELNRNTAVAAPADIAGFGDQIMNFAEQELTEFWGGRPDGLLLILDDAASLHQGKFREEHRLLRELFQRHGWRAGVGSPDATVWDGQNLLFGGQRVAFIVNRSTDFFWDADDFAALRMAYGAGRVCVAPNPFSYATRSDKRLLEWLSLADWDPDLGIRPEERSVLRAHVPETHLVRAENIDMLAQRKQEFVFKPLHGFAGRGLLDSAAVGRARLRRLLEHDRRYVAQRRVAKAVIESSGTTLWTDLRVWAWRGQIFNLSGRASCRPERLDLTPPGGWLPTFASLR